MTETARLVIAVDSSGAKTATRDLDKLTASAGKTEKGTLSLGKAFAYAGGAYGVLRLVKGYVSLADSSAKMAAQLRLSTKSQADFTKAQQETFQIAQRSGAELESVVALYAKLSLNTKELNISQDRLLGITETITKAFSVSGASAQEASGTIRQLSQAFASGTLRGDEFNSVMENGPRLAKAIADGLGVPIGKLRELAQQGKITSEAVALALETQANKIEEEYRTLPLTVGRATQELENALSQLVGKTEETEGATGDLAKQVQDFARLLESSEVQAGFATFVGGIVAIASAAAGALASVANLTRFIGEEVASRVNGPAGDDRVRLDDRLARLKKDRQALSGNALSAGVAAGARAIGLSQTLTGTPLEGSSIDVLASLESNRERIDAEIKKTEAMLAALDSLPPPKAAPATGDKPAGDKPFAPIKLGGGSSDKDADKAAREAIRLQEQRTEATNDFLVSVQRMRAEMEGPLAEVNQHYAEEENRLIALWAAGTLSVEQKTAALDLLEAARQRDIKAITDQITPEQEFINELQSELELMKLGNDEREREIALRQLGADATEEQKNKVVDLIAAIQDERAAQDKQREAIHAMDQVRYEASDALQSLINGTKSAKDALSDFFDSISQMITQRIADGLIEQLFGGFGTTGQGSSGGNLFSSFFGMLFGKAVGGSVKRGTPYLVGENGPEMIVPREDAHVMTADRTARMGGGNTTNINVSVREGTTRSTALQIAGEAARMQRLAARNA